MIYKPIKRKNGSIYMCPIQSESATENSIRLEHEIILELSEKLNLIETEMLNALHQSRACLLSWVTPEGNTPQDVQFKKMIREISDVIDKVS